LFFVLRFQLGGLGISCFLALLRGDLELLLCEREALALVHIDLLRVCVLQLAQAARKGSIALLQLKLQCICCQPQLVYRSLRPEVSFSCPAALVSTCTLYQERK
jgi:hypothetical protein